MNKLINLGVLISARDMFSPKLKTATSSLTKFETKIKSIGASMTKFGAGSAAVGTAILAPLKSFYTDYTDVAKKEGELESLGIGAKGIDTITKSAKNFTNQFARISTPEFLNAAYDIKSGISSLSDEGVAKMTTMSSMTAQATKGSAEGMAKLFALGHGIFGKDFAGDFDFAEKFSAAVSTTVKAFRTDGDDVALGLSNIGAGAKSMGVSLQEELSILGGLKSSFNTAAEAGTAYRAFLDGVGKAQESLGLKFTDSKGHLLPMANILEKIKGKYKDLKKLEVKDEIKDAFGSGDAYKLISGLILKTDEFSEAQANLSENMKKGTAVTKEMADKMNKGYGIELMTNRLVNLTSTIGSYLEPKVEAITSKIGNVAIKVTKWMEDNGELAKSIVAVGAGVGAVLLGVGTFGVTMGAIAFIVPSIVSGIGAVTTAISFLGKAALLNPIGLVITAIAGAAFVVYKYWEPIKGFFVNLWGGIKEVFSVSGSIIIGVFEYSARKIKEPFVAVFDWFVMKFQWLETKVLGVVSTTKNFFGTVGKSTDEFLSNPFGLFKKETKINAVQPKTLSTSNIDNKKLNKNQNVTIQKIEINNPTSTVEVQKGIEAGLKKSSFSLSDEEL